MEIVRMEIVLSEIDMSILRALLITHRLSTPELSQQADILLNLLFDAKKVVVHVGND